VVEPAPRPQRYPAVRRNPPPKTATPGLSGPGAIYADLSYQERRVTGNFPPVVIFDLRLAPLCLLLHGSHHLTVVPSDFLATIL
jgi:hypothetical protein